MSMCILYYTDFFLKKKYVYTEKKYVYEKKKLKHLLFKSSCGCSIKASATFDICHNEKLHNDKV